MYKIHIHTDYSNLRLLDSIIKTKGGSLFEYAREIGCKGIAVTDHENLSGHVKLEQISKDYPDIKLVRGNEIYLVEERVPGQPFFHFLILSKDKIGHKMMRELSSKACLESFYANGMERVPTLKRELEAVIAKYGKGHLIATSACLGGELSSLVAKLNDAEKVGDSTYVFELKNEIVNFMNFCIKNFGEDFYIEVAPNDKEPQVSVNKRLKVIAESFGCKIIYGDDAHYLRKEDAPIHEAYLKSKDGERETAQFYSASYLQKEEEVWKHLSVSFDNQFIAKIMKNNEEIFDKCEDYSLFHKQQIPEVDVTDYKKSTYDYIPKDKYPVLNKLMQSDNIQERYWVNETLLELSKRPNINNETYFTRLEEEADIKDTVSQKLETCMFAYPNTLKHYIDLFWECGSTVGAGRGSACAGLNHYLLGITQLDPIEWELPFWRYINKSRIEIGDIDIDLAPSKRPLIFQKIREERGMLGITQIATFGTETAKSAILTACRGYRSEECPEGIDTDEAKYFSSLVPQERGFLWSLNDVVFGNEEKGRKKNSQFINAILKYDGLLTIMLGIEGLVNKKSTHASGVNFYGEDPFETTCFMKSPGGDICTQYDLHDCEYCGDTKYDFLVTEVQDVIIQTVELLQEYGHMEKDLSLREIYNKYLHPAILDWRQPEIWEALEKGTVLKCFQFDSPVGAQAAAQIKAKNPLEMSDSNGLMRLMTGEKGAETLIEKYVRFKNNINNWYQEMGAAGLSKKEQDSLKKHYLKSHGVPISQEQLMTILMDKEICEFDLAEANEARKIVGKKQMSKIPQLKDQVLSKAKSIGLGDYVWKTGIAPQLGYSFSVIHALAYSFIGIQTLYLATQYNPIFWNVSCLNIDSGMGEDASSDYGKIAKALGTIISKDIEVSLLDINKSKYKFEPDVEKNKILFGLKGVSGINGETIDKIINNRPYKNMVDFINKTGLTKSSMIPLIKAGAFDTLEGKSKKVVLAEYLWIVTDKKKKLTLQNFNGLIQHSLTPDTLDREVRIYNFNKYIKKFKKGNYYILDDSAFEFYKKCFNEEETCIIQNLVCIQKDVWDAHYQSAMDKVRAWIKATPTLLDTYNKTLFLEVWNKYALGTISAWEMSSVCFYSSKHELANINLEKYAISNFSNLSEEPEAEKYYKKKVGGVETSIPIFKINRIIGTVIDKSAPKSTVTLLTTTGVVNVKFSKEYFSMFNKQISVKGADGKKKVVEKSWFARGSMIMVNGIRRGEVFQAKTYANTKAHQLYRIAEIINETDLLLQHERYQGGIIEEEDYSSY